MVFLQSLWYTATLLWAVFIAGFRARALPTASSGGEWRDGDDDETIQLLNGLPDRPGAEEGARWYLLDADNWVMAGPDLVLTVELVDGDLQVNIDCEPEDCERFMPYIERSQQVILLSLGVPLENPN